VNRIPLSSWQAQILEPYFAMVREEAARESPGMLVAQLSRDSAGRYWMQPAFLPNETADLITKKGRQLP
jgi:hypothetical protein